MKRLALVFAALLLSAPSAFAKEEPMVPEFSGADRQRLHIDVALTPVASKFIQITELQFVPGDPELMIVFEKQGNAFWLDLAKNTRGTFFRVRVLDAPEEGLLGLAFHPKFKENGKFYVNDVVPAHGQHVSQVTEWSVSPGSDLRKAVPKLGRVILEVVQPYVNHNGGGIVFGPDGYLYIGWGDGGAGGDPYGNGQNNLAMLGKMLRIDVDKKDSGKEYASPPDNPFFGKEGYLPEIWATGMRNPWRFSFDPKGRLIAGDVGQDSFEEVDLIERGGNYGWNLREARHCFKPKEGCRETGLTDPIFEFGRDDGGSVTGGFVALGDSVPALKDKYVFGDFLSGRLWALDLPDKNERGGPLARAYALGHWPILPSTFARDDRGRIYVADYPDGMILRIDPPKR